MKKILYILPSMIFNFLEAVLVFLGGIAIKVPIPIIILIVLVFSIVRMCTRSAKHYKSWVKCMIWSTIVILSLLVVTKVDLLIAIAMTVFSAIVLSGKGDIKDCFMWAKKESKFSDIDKYIKENSENNDLLMEVENRLEEKDYNAYILYKYRFKENKTFTEMSNLTNMDSRRIADKLNEVALSIRTFCNI